MSESVMINYIHGGVSCHSVIFWKCIWEMQNGLVPCICSKACRHSAVNGFGVVVGSQEI